MKDYIKKIKTLRSKKKFSISVAESCTGGMISSYLTSISGSSAFYDGSIISYSNTLKHRLLDVPKSTIEKYGAVSHQTALAMIKGLNKKSESNILISVTGVAGPEGGSKKTPVGCVFFGIGHKINDKFKFATIKKVFRLKSRKMIQQKSTEYALKKIITIVGKI